MARRSTGATVVNSESEEANCYSRTSFSEDHVLCATCVLWGAVDSSTSYNKMNGHDVSAVELCYGNP
jgi:hypothetical protein